jgi:hypothetical protein
VFYACLMFPMCATCHAHLIFPDYVTIIISGEAYKLRSSSLCSLLLPPSTSSLLRIIFSQHPVLKHLQSTCMFFPWYEWPSFTPKKNK